MSVDLWISVALAIPLAIAANIVTPRVQHWLDARLSKGRERKVAEQSQKRQTQVALLRKEYDEVATLHADPAKLTHHYLDTLFGLPSTAHSGRSMARFSPYLERLGAGKVFSE